MTDFYINYHGALFFRDGFFIVPKNVCVYLYNYPGYIAVGLYRENHKEIGTSENLVLKYSPGDLIFNVIFRVFQKEIDISNKKKKCHHGRIAKTNKISIPNKWTNFDTDCVDPTLRQYGNNAFNLIDIVENLPNVKNIHIYSCLLFKDDIGCKIPMYINKKPFCHQSVRRIGTAYSKQFDMQTNFIGLTKFDTYSQFEQWKKKDTKSTSKYKYIDKYFTFAKNENKFIIIDDTDDKDILEIFYENIAIKSFKVFTFQPKSLLKCVFTVFVLVKFLTIPCTEIIPGGIYDTTMQNQHNVDEIKEKSKPINIIQIMESNKNNKNKKILSDYNQNKLVKFTKEEICEFFKNNN